MLRISAITCFIFFFSACSNKSDSTLAIFKATEEGFLYSNSVFSNSSAIIYESFVERLLKPATVEQASVWQPKAMRIKEKSTAIFKYLDSLITELKKEAGLRLENMTEVYNEDENENFNPNIVDDLEPIEDEKETKFNAIEKALMKMKEAGGNCYELLTQFWYHKKTMNELTEIFGYTNADNTKNQKSRCQKRLEKLAFNEWNN